MKVSDEDNLTLMPLACFTRQQWHITVRESALAMYTLVNTRIHLECEKAFLGLVSYHQMLNEYQNNKTN